MCLAEYGTAWAVVTGYAGETYLKKRYEHAGKIVLCSNYLGYLLDCAEEFGMQTLLLAGVAGKLMKPAANIFYLHSHTAGGQREILCTHAALAGATTAQIQQLYACNTTTEMQELLAKMPFSDVVWQSIAEAALENCQKRTHGTMQIGLILLDRTGTVLAETEQVSQVGKAWCQDA